MVAGMSLDAEGVASAGSCHASCSPGPEVGGVVSHSRASVAWSDSLAM